MSQEIDYLGIGAREPDETPAAPVADPGEDLVDQLLREAGRTWEVLQRDRTAQLRRRA
ncbi:MAG TPA: hypothetical protein VF157_01210 [Chloroflexota bacterium]